MVESIVFFAVLAPLRSGIEWSAHQEGQYNSNAEHDGYRIEANDGKCPCCTKSNTNCNDDQNIQVWKIFLVHNTFHLCYTPFSNRWANSPSFLEPLENNYQSNYCHTYQIGHCTSIDHQQGCSSQKQPLDCTCFG